MIFCSALTGSSRYLIWGIQWRFSDADKLAIAITQEFSTLQFGWKVLGALLKQADRITDSLTPMQKSVQLAPPDAEAQSNLGVTLKELGRLEESEASLRQAIILKPDYAVAHYYLIRVLYNIGHKNLAWGSTKKANHIDSQSKKLS